MTSSEKAELLKETIKKLYSDEGRSKSYIGRLLGINRKIIADKITEWNLPAPKPQRHAKPSAQKYINKNREKIKAMLDNDIPITEIARTLNITRDFLNGTIFPCDNVLQKAREDHERRRMENADKRREAFKEKSNRNYEYEDLPGEIWKPVLGYENYDVSNMGRVRKEAKRYKSYYLLALCQNKNNGRLYVCLFKGKNRERKNLQLSRVVAHAFVDGFSEEKKVVNHIDGDVTNCKAENLEWVTPSENNYHAYEVLNRTRTKGQVLSFRKLIYKKKYEFNTIAALARFLKKSETQTRRYLDNPEKHEIEIIR